MLTQFISALRYIANDFELFSDHFKQTSLVTTELFSNITDLQILMSKDGIQEEQLFSRLHSLNQHLSVMTPNFFLDFFKTFEIFFSLGNTFFSDNPFISDLEKLVQESIDSSKAIGNFIPYTGRTIKEILISENRTMDQLPKALVIIFECMYNKGCFCKGIFRESSNASIRQIEELCMRMSVTNFNEIPCDVVASVFKKFLRNLPIHIFDRTTTKKIFQRWIEIIDTQTDSKLIVNEIKELIQCLPPEHMTVFKETMKLCYKIVCHSEINAMNAKNLSVCLSTNLMTLSEFDQLPLNGDSKNEYSLCIDFIRFCILSFTSLFPQDIDPVVTKRANFLGERKPQQINCSTLTQSPSTETPIQAPNSNTLAMKIPEKQEINNTINIIPVDKTPETTNSMADFMIQQRTKKPQNRLSNKLFNQIEVNENGSLVHTQIRKNKKISDDKVTPISMKNLFDNTQVQEITEPNKSNDNTSINEMSTTTPINSEPSQDTKQKIDIAEHQFSRQSTLTTQRTQLFAPRVSKVVFGQRNTLGSIRVTNEQQLKERISGVEQEDQSVNNKQLSPLITCTNQSKRPGSFISKRTGFTCDSRSTIQLSTESQKSTKEEIQSVNHPNEIIGFKNKETLQQTEGSNQTPIQITVLPYIPISPKQPGLSSSRVTSRFINKKEEANRLTVGTEFPEKELSHEGIETMILGEQEQNDLDKFKEVTQKAMDDEKIQHIQEEREKQKQLEKGLCKTNNITNEVVEERVKIQYSGILEEKDCDKVNEIYEY
ncbi:RhoGAP domain containing protein [Entamoeba histolytica HM-1:IMSS-B]|uniref:RhoGAP domain containing protein n=6 Tax=Entamoeba histolytica TaxID=5759 RepID=C4LTC3_ENTH1|nr:RhoGAP domain containing protein [Entamoeba histolytica HM-1:IMSS]EMD45951.1 T-cell activation Rho GTPase activating protein, putative [Entamoeba histolytica KU27]EMH76580.1 RhoGAP domain containing protein [Entamoeba histolytica HM-1:IMSS-B]EMS12402.1 T-cell activation Rho GTPase activating protein, putative [Entamoeba histolytica HM-3:IMSS]ENY62878.1 RhoGAP domain containing protein [Entamoeba histolytica HM-1:IMSS-A]EAL51883.2 RhoGAP domain containing protein [Entamoeba histolytica HM-1:|eukprot:XP_657331.2 RhoGAP domain containing protein [Entamoeba histolytica HM-1:IMSS]